MLISLVLRSVRAFQARRGGLEPKQILPTSLTGDVTSQAAQAHYVWVRASEVIWSEDTRIITVLSDVK